MKKYIGTSALNELTSIIKSDMDKIVNHNHNELYALKSHTHDDRYYTESEINNKISQSDGITQTCLYMLDAVEKNPSVNGTLANQISKISNIGTSISLYDTSIYISDTGSDNNDGKIKSKPLKTIKRFKQLYGDGIYRVIIVGTLTINDDQTIACSYFHGVSSSEPGTLVIKTGKHLRFTTNVIIENLTIQNNDGHSSYCIRSTGNMYIYKITIDGNFGINSGGFVSISTVNYTATSRLNFFNSFLNIYGQKAQAGDAVNTVSWLAYVEHCLIFAGAHISFPNVNGKFTYVRWAD